MNSTLTVEFMLNHIGVFMSHNTIDQLTKQFLTNGGKITVLPPKLPPKKRIKR